MDRTKFLGITTLACFVLLCSCNTAEQKNGAYEFYYYPEKNLYYNTATATYFYSLDGGLVWDSAKRVAGTDDAMFGKNETISSPVKDVWKENTLHRQKFNSKVYNIIRSGDGANAAAYNVAEKKAIRKSGVSSVGQAPKKKGLKKFLDNIFGKKKKN